MSAELVEEDDKYWWFHMCVLCGRIFKKKPEKGCDCDTEENK